MVNSNGRTVMTGLGLLASNGVGIEEVWRAVLAGHTQCRTVTYQLGQETIAYPAYPVDEIPLSDFTTSDDRRWIRDSHLEGDRDFAMMIVAARLALTNSNLQFNPLENRIGLVIAHENPGVITLVDRILRQLITPDVGADTVDIAGRMRQFGDAFYNLQTFPHLFYLARLLGTKGPSLIVNNACASGLYALEVAHQMVQSGQADAVIVVSSDHGHVTEYLWLQQQGFYSRSGQMRPFDRRRDGAVIGDGAAAVVVESVTHAERRGATPRAAYLGGYSIQDTWRMSMPDPSSGSYEKVIRGALATAALPQNAVDLVVPHGTGSPLLDRYEAEGIRRAFQPGVIPPVTSFKPYVGHTLGTSALLELLLMVKAMETGTIPHTLGCQELDPAIRLPVVTETLHRPLRIGMKTVSAFAGFTAAAVVGREP